MVACPHQRCGVYIFCQIFHFQGLVDYNTNRSIVIIYLWSLVDPPDVPLVHYGKWEVAQLISSMEPEFKIILRWMGSAPAEVPGALSQWGHSISIARNPKRITGSKRKSFMADMYSFETDGEPAAICNYLRTHGGYEIEQVPYLLCNLGGAIPHCGGLVNCDWSISQATGHLSSVLVT